MPFPVTSIHRTLLDLAEVVHPQRLRTAVEAAERQDLFDLRPLEELLARSPGRRGVKPLRALLGEFRGPPPETRSELERRFLELIRAAGLPEPSVNVVVAGETVDFYWPGPTLVVELDGYKFHKSRRAFEDNRAMDAKLQVAGCAVVRFTPSMLHNRPATVVGDVRTLLEARGARD